MITAVCDYIFVCTNEIILYTDVYDREAQSNKCINNKTKTIKET